MRRICILVAVGLLAFGSLSRADEVVQPYQAVAADSGACCAMGECGRKHRPLLRWLTYRPLSRPGLGGCCKQPACCRPPLYAWFLDYCYAGSQPSWGAQAIPCDCGSR